MKIVYEQTYVPYVDITIIMKAIYDKDNEQTSYKLSGYYFGKPSLDGLETFKESVSDKNIKYVDYNVRNFFKENEVK